MPPYALYVNDEVKTNGSMRVHGFVGTNSKDKNSVDPSISFVEGGIKAPARDEQGNLLSLPSLPPFPKIPSYECSTDKLVKNNCELTISNNEKLTLQESTKIDTINIGENKELTITVHDTINLVVKNLSIAKNGKLTVKGAGTLNLFLTNDFQTKNNSQLNFGGKPHQLNIFYKGEYPVQFKSGQQLYGSIYVDSADITITGSSIIRGNIFSGGKSVTTNAVISGFSQVIIAPRAIVDLLGTIHFFGMVIADAVNANGSGDFFYVDCTNQKHKTEYYYACPEPINDGPISINVFKNGGENGNETSTNGKIEIEYVGNTREVK